MRENAGKMRSRISPNMDTFYGVICSGANESESWQRCRYYFPQVLAFALKLTRETVEQGVKYVQS